MKHGGEIAAPVVRDVVKAYYDKKNLGGKQQLTAANDGATERNGPQPAALTESRPAGKQNR
jgi:hypothetical protein